MSNLLRFIILSLSVVTLLFSGFSTQAKDRRPPQSPAVQTPSKPRATPASLAREETLTYTALLNELPAGEAELRLHKEQQNGSEIYRVTGRARTNEIIDYLYRMRGTVEGRFTVNGLAPLLFQLSYTDNGRPRELAVRYDAKTKTLQGSAKRKNKVAKRSVPATNVYDPSTALYRFRSTELTPGKTFQVEVFTGKERYRVTVQVIGKENVQLTSGERPAIRLHPIVFSVDDTPQKNLIPEETTLWVATDAAHTPLKLESFLPIGQIVLELSNSS